MKVSDNTPAKEINEVVLVKVDSTVSLVSPSDNNAEESVSVRQFSRGNYKIVNIVANLDQTMEVAYLLPKAQDEQKQARMVTIQQNGFDLCRGVLPVTFRTIVDSSDTKPGPILVEDGV